MYVVYVHAYDYVRYAIPVAFPRFGNKCSPSSFGSHAQVVILDNEEPSDEVCTSSRQLIVEIHVAVALAKIYLPRHIQQTSQLVEVLEAPLIESRVTFIKGTIMDEEALIRAGAKSAVAAFVFSDGYVLSCRGV